MTASIKKDKVKKKMTESKKKKKKRKAHDYRLSSLLLPSLLMHTTFTVP